jgi:hypothetical protein
VRQTTIAALTALRAPSDLPATRLRLERRVYRVTARVTLVRHEADDDFHLVLRDSTGHHMIAESPLPGCTSGATRLRRRQMAQARRAVRLCQRATVTGVLFFDFQHGQTGVAPNAIELHPSWRFAACAPSGRGTTCAASPPTRTRRGSATAPASFSFRPSTSS